MVVTSEISFSYIYCALAKSHLLIYCMPWNLLSMFILFEVKDDKRSASKDA